MERRALAPRAAELPKSTWSPGGPGGRQLQVTCLLSLPQQTGQGLRPDPNLGSIADFLCDSGQAT